MAKVLLVEDEPAMQLVVRQMLESGGHSVLTAQIGHALLEDLKLADYELVVTDLHMPVLDGWDVVAWLRERRNGVPVIAIGGNVSGGRNAPMDGFDAVLAKPFRREDLLRAVEKATRTP